MLPHWFQTLPRVSCSIGFRGTVAAAGIPFASTQSAPPWLPCSAIPNSAKTAPERALDLVDLFSRLTEEERKILTEKAKHRHYDAAEILVEPGQVLNVSIHHRRRRLCRLHRSFLRGRSRSSASERAIISALP